MYSSDFLIDYHKRLWKFIKEHISDMRISQAKEEFFKENWPTNFELLDGCMFYAISGLFDEYINKYMHIKQNSKGALRTEAKLFLNNLYGKMASSPDSSYKVPVIVDDIVKFYPVDAQDKTPGYIPIGSAITSYARNFTIRRAQLNYHGPNKPGFCYADTDSIHCDILPDKLVGVDVHPTNMFIKCVGCIIGSAVSTAHKCDSCPFDDNICCDGFSDYAMLVHLNYKLVVVGDKSDKILPLAYELCDKIINAEFYKEIIKKYDKIFEEICP